VAANYSFVTAANGFLSVAVLESGGGTDIANLTSTGGGVFVSTSTVDTLTVGSVTITVDTFVSTGSGLVAGASHVSVTGSGSLNGTDSAYLYDSPGHNALVAGGTLATLTTDNGTLSVNQFGKVTALRQNGLTDTLHKDALDFALATTGLWTSV
jgi:hypothetical protein